MPDDLYQDFEESKKQHISRLNHLARKWDDGSCASCDEKDAAIKELVEALEGLYNHTKNNHCVHGLNVRAQEALAKYKDNPS